MSGWRRIALRYLAREWCDGPFGSGIATEHYRETGARVVRLQNIRAVAFDDKVSAFLDEEYFRTSLARHEVLAGDVLIAGLGDDNNLVGRACVAPTGLGPALVKADCFRFRMDLAKADPRFVAYALSSSAGAAGGELANGSTRKRINLSSMAGRTILAPGRHEQERTANFLDEQTARIDALIAEKDQLGRSLEEFRLSAIHEALSVGLDREASTVDTGDEWFARVPTHWAFCPLNYRYEVQLGKMLDEKRITGAHLLPYLRNTDVQWDRINSDSLPEMDIAPTEMPRYSVRAGDLLVCEGGEVGRAAIWEGPENAIGYQKALHRVRPRTTGDVPRFLFYALFDSAKRGRFESRDKATIAHLTAEAFRRYRFTFPPYAEQTAIVQHLDSLTSKIDGLQSHCTEHINRLREYRSSLISAAVTGQLDINSYKEAA